MKKSLLMLAVCTACAAFAAFVAPVAENLVKNAGFKSITLKTGLPSGWSNAPALSGERMELNPGQYALKLASPVKGKRAFWVGTLGKIDHGVTYTVRARVLAAAGAVCQFYVERSKPAFKAFNGNRPIRGIGAWVDISFDFCFDTAGGQPYIAFATGSMNPSMLADVRVFKKETK